jgi:hypothetical protein
MIRKSHFSEEQIVLRKMWKSEIPDDVSNTTPGRKNYQKGELQ